MNVVSLRAALNEPTPVHFMGRLSMLMPDGLIAVEDEQGSVRLCRRAASCLLRPAVGDLVLVSGPDSTRAYLIAVIEQADGAVSHIDSAGELKLGGQAGVSIESAGDVRIQSDATLEMKSRQWSMRAGQGLCHIDEMRYTSHAVDATVGRFRLVGKVFEVVVDRIVQMARNALRLVDEIDQVRVGHLDCKATETVRIHGNHTVVTGKDLVKVDAAQIHMG
ncbi:DUF3540 domain-containing protein [Variovorax sp. Root411]|uniref:DUF3540 domain-containing protein n=1 Tax=Variovorax sp. Root411 TaxID=1736530 RepID=UPI000701EFD6|nr:DUF3540 domain-containing protein [Variovorax sp. Root411]KQW59533.1 hypothetical protein ASC92_07910 [Variovorax sp. Root411]